VAVWTFAVGLFTPFFNVYFAKHLGASVERIGTLFSAGQAAQVAALLAAPALLKRFGRLNAVMAMQFATGLALAGLAAGSRGLFGATFFYVAFMALQYMSEPGIYSLLMDGVRPHERTGASAVNFLTIFSMQAIAAAAAGTAFAHFGFRPVLCVAASLAVLAGILFRRLLDRFDK
jgi:MFS family permease